MDAARLREDAQQAGEKLRGSLAQGLGHAQEAIEENVRRGLDQTRGAVTTLNEQFGSFVRQSPLMALGGAFVIGYVAAKVARAFK
jgi:hypothetical protein